MPSPVEQEYKLSKFVEEFTVDANTYDIGLNLVYYSIRYLNRFGYLQNFNFTIDDFKNRVIKFQELFGITLDGEIGPEVLAMMQLPRCGHPDIAFSGTESVKWDREVRYFVEDAPRIDGINNNKEAFAETIKQGFKAWQDVCGFPKVTQVGSKSQCNYYFDTRRGRANRFDGPSGTLAYNTLGRANPSISFYDGDENWTLGGRSGIVLLNVITHEIGHGLDMDHSRVRGALMAPTYSRNVCCPQKNDDIPRAQRLYGPPVSTPNPTPTPEPTPTPDPTPTPPPAPDDPGGKSDVIYIKLEGEVQELIVPGFRCIKMN